MKWILLVPFTEEAYSKLAHYLSRFSRKVFLPIPRSLCNSAQNSRKPVNYPASLLKVWKPVMELIDQNLLPSYECYLEDADIHQYVESGVKLALLVIKARAYGKVDIFEWLSIAHNISKSRIMNWSGLLVVDRFLDYYLLMKSGVEADRVMKIDTFFPTPIDIFVIAANKLVEFKCSLGEVISWIVKYIGEIVLPSTNLSAAYRKLINSNDYREFMIKCVPDLSLFMCLNGSSANGTISLRNLY